MSDLCHKCGKPVGPNTEDYLEVGKIKLHWGCSPLVDIRKTTITIEERIP